jgi:hypothetical protein
MGKQDLSSILASTFNTEMDFYSEFGQPFPSADWLKHEHEITRKEFAPFRKLRHDDGFLPASLAFTSKSRKIIG